MERGEYTDEQIRKIRRRIEDYLRKAKPEKIIETAIFLDIKID